MVHSPCLRLFLDPRYSSFSSTNHADEDESDDMSQDEDYSQDESEEEHKHDGCHIVKLFGGHITARIPRVFASLSDARQVPDNAEMLQDLETDDDRVTSIVVELNERVDLQPGTELDQPFDSNDLVSDEERKALGEFEYHINDIVATDKNRHVEFPVVQPARRLGHSARPECATYTTLIHQTSDPDAPAGTMSVVNLAFGLVRFVPADGDMRRAADVLVTVSVKMREALEYDAEEWADFDWRSAYGLLPGTQLEDLIARAVRIRDRILETFTVVDDSLFDSDSDSSLD